jgi:hypothetical protein
MNNNKLFSRIIKSYLNGTPEERKLIDKMYPEFCFSDFKGLAVGDMAREGFQLNFTLERKPISIKIVTEGFDPKKIDDNVWRMVFNLK